MILKSSFLFVIPMTTKQVKVITLALACINQTCKSIQALTSDPSLDSICHLIVQVETDMNVINAFVHLRKYIEEKRKSSTFYHQLYSLCSKYMHHSNRNDNNIDILDIQKAVK
jgi:pyruvate carboxylase